MKLFKANLVKNVRTVVKEFKYCTDTRTYIVGLHNYVTFSIRVLLSLYHVFFSTCYLKYNLILYEHIVSKHFPPLAGRERESLDSLPRLTHILYVKWLKLKHVTDDSLTGFIVSKSESFVVRIDQFLGCENGRQRKRNANFSPCTRL